MPDPIREIAGPAGSLEVLLEQPAGDVRAPALAVTAVDTTGAGDAFNAALAAALAERQPLAGALRFANVVAALACTKRGAQPSMPHRAELAGLDGGEA